MYFGRFVLLTIAIAGFFALATNNDMYRKCHEYCTAEAVSCSSAPGDKTVCKNETHVCRGQCDLISHENRPVAYWSAEPTQPIKPFFDPQKHNAAVQAATQKTASQIRAARNKIFLSRADLCIQRCDMTRHACNLGGNDDETCTDGREACAARCSSLSRSQAANNRRSSEVAVAAR